MENPRFPTLHHSLRAAFLLLPVALRAKHSQKGIAKDFLANGQRKTKPISLEEKRSFSTLKIINILFVFRSYQKTIGTVLSRRNAAHSPRRKIESLKQCREDISGNFSFFAPIIVQAYDE